MPKQGEIDYVMNLAATEIQHAQGKPFTDQACGLHFLNLGVLFSLLPTPPARLLDLGVGTGWTSGLFARRGFDVVGVDIAPDMIALAQEQLQASPDMTLRFLALDYERLDFHAEFAAAVFYDSLHHAEDELEALAGAYRALLPGGVCITVEPGNGHGASPVAQNAIARFGTTEKDMPPRRIIELGKRVGFSEFRIYPRPDVFAAITEPAHKGEFVRYIKAFVRNVAKAIIGPRRRDRHFLDKGHIVWMRK